LQDLKVLAELSQVKERVQLKKSTRLFKEFCDLKIFFRFIFCASFEQKRPPQNLTKENLTEIET